MPPHDPPLPANVRLARDARISGSNAFTRFVSRREIAITLGERSHADRAHFAIGADGCVAIGEDCYLNDCILLAQDEIRIGNHVMMDNYRGPCSIEKRRAYIRAILQNSGRAMDIQTQAKPIVAQIGNDSIDGARSVVTESIPDLAVAAGNPARLIRRLADPD